MGDRRVVQTRCRAVAVPSRSGVNTSRAAVDLHWIPLGAGAHLVRLCGKLFEAFAALFARRPRRELYHSALEVLVPEGRYVIEMTPIPDGHGNSRGVVAEGAVGATWAGRLPMFRYEIRRWRDGVIPDASAAISGPVRVSEDLDVARRILDLASSVPTAVWGRDELHTGAMWNSNSVTSWLLTRGGVDTAVLQPPHRGRAPGWDAGLVVAARVRAQGVPSARAHSHISIRSPS